MLIVLTPLAILRLLAARGSTRLAWPAIGILAMALVGTAVSPDRAVSLQKLSGIVVGVLALAAVQAHARSAGGFAAVMIVFVALATVAVAAGGAALVPGVTEMLPARAALQRTVPAATVHPNGVAGLVLMILPGLLLLVVSRAVWVRSEAALARATARAGHGRRCFAPAPPRSASPCWRRSSRRDPGRASSAWSRRSRWRSACGWSRAVRRVAPGSRSRRRSSPPPS